MKISTKLIGSFALIIVLALISGIVSMFTLTTVSGGITEIYTRHVTGLEYLAMASKNFEQIRLSCARAGVEILLGNKDSAEAVKKETYAKMDEAEECFLNFAAVLDSDDREIKAELDTLISLREFLFNNIDDFFNTFDNAYNGNTEDFTDKMNKMSSNIGDIEANIDKFIKLENAAASQMEKSKKRIADISKIVQIIMLAVIILFSLTITFAMSIGIEKDLQKLVIKLMSSANAIRNSVSQLSDASEGLAAGSTKQAAALEETTAAMNQAASAVSQNTENTREATKIASEANERANIGMVKMDKMVNSMEQIKESSNTVGNIIKAINDISFQTKLLALNATIEAARAGGEASRSFSVVAGEIGNLAQRSEKEASETTVIISNNVSLTNTGRDMSKEVAETLSGITSAASNLNTILKEISASSEEQEIGIIQINTALGEIEHVTQETAAVAEKNATLAHNVKSEVDNLVDAMQSAKKLIGYRDN